MDDTRNLLQSIDECISILQGDLYQPGTPAVVLKLASSWQKLKPFLAHHEQNNSDNSVGMVEDDTCSLQTANVERNVFQILTYDHTSEHNEDTERVVCASEEQDLSLEGVTDIQSAIITSSDSSGERFEQIDSEAPVLITENGKELTLGLPVKRPVVSGGFDKTSADDQGVYATADDQGVYATADDQGVYATDSLDPTNTGTDIFEAPSLGIDTLEPTCLDTESKDSSATVSQSVSATDYLEPPHQGTDNQSSTITDNQGGSDADIMGEEYQKVEFAVLYWHKTTGYYYDPLTQQFFAPSYQQDPPQQQTIEESVPMQAVERDAPSLQDYYNVSQSSVMLSSHTSVTASTGQTSHSGSDQTSIADMLAAASDRVVERCGYQYNEGLDMYYDASNGLYYHQESKLYYDAELGCFYEYDYENKKYTVHSRVKLPDTEDREERKPKDVGTISSSEEEYLNSPEEGEIRVPHYPHKSPPPEEEWDPCIRVLVSESETLPKGTLFVVTQDGASIGREPCGDTNTLIKIPELKVSKLHAVITYDRHERCYKVKDMGSVNGTFLKDQRLSQAKECSKLYPLEHGHTLNVGSTTLTLHIHTGWETCAWCDPARGAWQGLQSTASVDARGAESSLELDSQRKRELNRIKRKYGLSMKDTYGDKEVVVKEGYMDRSESRRKKIGSDIPASQRPDDAPSSVHRPIEKANKGRKMLEKMGWHSGGGLGRDEDGIMEPVKTEIRDPDAKLGLGMSPFHVDPGSATAKSQKIKMRYDDVLRHQKDVKRRKVKDSS